MSIDALALMLAFGSSVAGFASNPQMQPLHKQQHSSSSSLSGAPSDDWFPYSGSIRPGQQSPQRTVPEDRVLPSYAHDGVPKDNRSAFPWVITPKTPEEIQKMRASGKLARQVLDLAGRSVAVGVTTDEIDVIVHDAIVEVRTSSVHSVYLLLELYPLFNTLPSTTATTTRLEPILPP